MTTDIEDIQRGKDIGMIIAKLDTLSQGQTELHTAIKELDSCFDRFKDNIGRRIQETEKNLGVSQKDIGILQSEVAMVLWVLRGVATPILGAVGLAIMGFLVWHFAKSG